MGFAYKTFNLLLIYPCFWIGILSSLLTSHVKWRLPKWGLDCFYWFSLLLWLTKLENGDNLKLQFSREQIWFFSIFSGLKGNQEKWESYVDFRWILRSIAHIRLLMDRANLPSFQSRPQRHHFEGQRQEKQEGILKNWKCNSRCNKDYVRSFLKQTAALLLLWKGKKWRAVLKQKTHLSSYLLLNYLHTFQKGFVFHKNLFSIFHCLWKILPCSISLLGFVFLLSAQWSICLGVSIISVLSLIWKRSTATRVWMRFASHTYMSWQV